MCNCFSQNFFVDNVINLINDNKFINANYYSANQLVQIMGKIADSVICALYMQKIICYYQLNL